MPALFDNNSANYFSRANSAGFISTGDQTISYWHKQNTGETNNGFIFSVHYGGNEYSSDYCGAAGNLVSREEATAGTTTTIATMTRGSWNHVVRRLSGTTLDIFINGVIGDTDTFDPSTRSGSAGSLYVGRDSFGNPFWGDLCDFCVWNRALTTAEVLRLRRSRKPVAQGLQIWWPMHGGSNRTVDYSGSGRHLTSNGTITDGANPPSAWNIGRQVA